MTFIKHLLGASTVLGAEDTSVSEQSSIMMTVNVGFLLCILSGDCLTPWIWGLVSFRFGNSPPLFLWMLPLFHSLPQKL